VKLKKDSTQRFTNTVPYYSKYRPSYPPEAIDLLRLQCGLTPNTVIADIGSGTGILTQLLLELGNRVYAVEPNTTMRQAAEQALKKYPNFISVEGSAEVTTLTSNTIDLITVGTAFHWFDPLKSKIEFRRILTAQGWVALIFNVRDRNAPVVDEYEKLLLEYSKDYQETAAQKFDLTVTEEFFSPNKMYIQVFDNEQLLDWDGLQGRLRSTSYCLPTDDPNFDAMMNALARIFEKYEIQGKIRFKYLTKVYYGRLLYS
jgi:ubiquinone/menaquinone biosynthesis C-methylase UbiE